MIAKLSETIRSRRHKMKFVLDPNSDEIAIVPVGIDRREVFASNDEPKLPSQPKADYVAIARVFLACCPTCLVSIALDSRGRIIGSTLTPAPKGLTSAVFRAGCRSLPPRCKQVVFATGSSITPEVRDAATTAAEVCLIRVADFIIVESF